MRKHADIVICDSGISSWQRPYAKNLYGISGRDRHGHGTQLAEVIHMINKEALVGSIRILDEKKECTLDTMIKGLILCQKCDAKIVVLALAIDCDREIPVLREIIDELLEQGKIVVCSTRNGACESLPASYKGVLGVRRESYTKFDKDECIQLKIDIPNVMCQNKDRQISVFAGNSMACAYVAAKLSLIDNIEKLTIADIEKLLEKDIKILG